MSEVKSRLQETSATCLKAYEAWDGDKKDPKVREALQDAIHELRKVASRLEIDVAISERDQNAQKPLPIPPHRSSRGGRGNDNRGDDIGNAQGNGDAPQQKPQRRRTPRKASGGDE